MIENNIRTFEQFPPHEKNELFQVRFTVLNFIFKFMTRKIFIDV